MPLGYSVTKIKPGDRYGRFTVLERVSPINTTPIKWRCLCDCGREKTVNGSSLTRGASKSCGCLREERRAALSTSHGMSKTRVYRVWAAMIERCSVPENKSYPIYGGRGIHVCVSWKNFANFIADMGEPDPGMTLDRVDNDGPYSLENCRWATPTEQARNKRNNRLYPYQGEMLTLGEVSERTGITVSALKWRIHRSGWSLERAFTVPTMSVSEASALGKEGRLRGRRRYLANVAAAKLTMTQENLT